MNMFWLRTFGLVALQIPKGKQQQQNCSCYSEIKCNMQKEKSIKLKQVFRFLTFFQHLKHKNGNGENSNCTYPALTCLIERNY